ncbi:mediator of RNA polymerase II transcription subunit 1-domain-containing protein [Zychaea mexicana]|uniref:mediator of RNA polymerase II transcription subunit 1-domain-containing protein n=1 Tax=Zychaea mexicana TaxID=64656 RepID=UPI0022FF1BDA|nr:mediator of RNA polymerase II transcription subunit 1-domain-containing protein [Zychaea mexicana]KAI9492303.1 mediator of RNA polymerase II transcription subunit 1-domain-containing protein [Zychaea mexicana]
MQKATDLKNSISSSVYGIQHLFSDLEKQWSALKKTPQPPSVANEVHALGPANLDNVRHQFTSCIDSIRSICTQFETEVLSDVKKMGAGADPAFRKHLTHLKEQAQLENTVMRVKETLKDTKDQLEQSLNDREESKLSVQTRKLERLAHSLGLMPFVEASQRNESGAQTTTFTLGGTSIVVDIFLDEAGHVLRTKVTYVPDNLQSDQNDRVDQLLAKNMQSQTFDVFSRNVGALALLDQMNVKYAPTDFFLILRGLIADLQMIYSQEMQLLSKDVASVLMEGHGVPNKHLDYPGLSISYWISKELFLGSDWEAVGEAIEKDENHPLLSNTAKVLISFEESQQPQYFIPTQRKHFMVDLEESIDNIKESENGEHLDIVKERTWPKFMQPMRFVKMKPTYPNVTPVPVRFVAKLDPPIPAADAIVRKLMIATDLVNDSFAVVENTPSSDIPCLEDLLVKDNASSLNADTTWTVEFENASTQVYKYMRSSPTSGKILTRVPFNHPRQLHNILQYLRQQQMFNTLFQSIFNGEAKQQGSEKNRVLALDQILEESQSDDKLYVEVASVDAPGMIHLTLSLPPSAHSDRLALLSVSIEVPKDTPAKPVVRLDPPSAGERDPMHRLAWQPDIFDEDKMTRVIQTGYNIPLLVRWLWKRIEQHPEMDYIVQTSRLGLRRSRNEDRTQTQQHYEKRIRTEFDSFPH